MKKNKNVLVICPNPYSLYTISVIERLLQENISVSGVIYKNIFNLKRFKDEFKRDGSRLIKKIIHKLILRKKSYTNSSVFSIVDYMAKYNIESKSIFQLSKDHDIPLIKCDNINNEVSLSVLKEKNPSLVIFTGGGLIRDPFLQNSGLGVLNCHMGILPEYRGMDVVEWPILKNDFDELGFTVHIMEKGVDTGPILYSEKIKVSSSETITELRRRYEPLMTEAMVQTSIKYLNNHIVPKSQNKEDGSQYFIMHPILQNIMKKNLRNSKR